eukprot:10251637-Heterocapsa_arctica.AAC.1
MHTKRAAWEPSWPLKKTWDQATAEVNSLQAKVDAAKPPSQEMAKMGHAITQGQAHMEGSAAEVRARNNFAQGSEG